jgi:hypothetical protein
LTSTYNQAEVAGHLRTSRWTIHRITAAGNLASTRTGITAAALAALIHRSALPRRTETAVHEGASTLPKLYTLPEVAAQTGIKLRTLQDGARAVRFAHYKIGGQRLMDRQQIDDLIAGVMCKPNAAVNDADAELAARQAARRRGGRRRAA